MPREHESAVWAGPSAITTAKPLVTLDRRTTAPATVRSLRISCCRRATLQCGKSG